MFIDIIFMVLMVTALFKGFTKGFIVAIFSLLAFFIGLAAAMKLSAMVAGYLQEGTNISGKWLPVLSFLLVFMGVAFLVRLGGSWIQRTIEFVWLGWLNKVLGILLYAILYAAIFSVFLFYADQLNLLKPETIEDSSSYGYIQPIGPYVINTFGNWIPWFRDLFEQLEQFFNKFSNKNATA